MAFTATVGYAAPPTARGTVTQTSTPAGILTQVVPSGLDGPRHTAINYDINTHTSQAMMDVPQAFFTVDGTEVVYGYVAAGGSTIANGATCSINAATGVISAAGGPFINNGPAFAPTTTTPDYGFITRNAAQAGATLYT